MVVWLLPHVAISFPRNIKNHGGIKDLVITLEEGAHSEEDISVGAISEEDILEGALEVTLTRTQEEDTMVDTKLLLKSSDKPCSSIFAFTASFRV